MKTKIICIVLLLCTVALFSQKQQFVGFNFSGHIDNKSYFNEGIGVFYENKLTKHHGFEAGLDYLQMTEEIYDNNNGSGSSWLNIVKKGYLSLPVSYKFYTKIIDFSTGLGLTYFFQEKVYGALGTLPDPSTYEYGPNLYVGCNLKVSKDIRLSKKIILEPGIQFKMIFAYEYPLYGATLKLKYQL